MPRRLIVFLVATLVAASAGCGSPAPDQLVAGSSPYEFTGKTLDGADFDGRSLKGKPTVLWFWAPWCPTCVRQAQGVRESLAEHGTDVNFLGVAGMDTEAAMERFVAMAKIDGLTSISDEPGVVWKRFEVTAQSTFVFLDASGVVVGKGPLDAEEISSRVKTLAAG